MIAVEDQAGILSSAERDYLGGFVIETCRTGLQDTQWLQRIIIRRDGLTDYFGYWYCRYTRRGIESRRLQATIILNATYLVTLRALERTLCHEYGHNWTLGYLLMLDRIGDDGIYVDRAPWLYYRIRRLNPDEFVADENRGWERCDKEVLAEDYRIRFTPYKDGHRMNHLIGLPSSEVEDYLHDLGKPAWAR